MRKVPFVAPILGTASVLALFGVVSVLPSSFAEVVAESVGALVHTGVVSLGAIMCSRFT